MVSEEIKKPGRVSRCPFRRQSQAYILAQELIRSVRKENKSSAADEVSRDEDSMENIDAYWKLANKELELVEHKTLGEPSGTGTAGAGVDNCEPRKSFDEEFEQEFEEVKLCGFSDSSSDYVSKSNEGARSARIATLHSPNPTVYNCAGAGSCVSLDLPSDFFDERSERRRKSSLRLGKSSLVVKSVNKPKSGGSARCRAAQTQPLPIEVSSKGGSKGLLSTKHKEARNRLLVAGKGLLTKRVVIGEKKERKLSGSSIYYVLKGSAIVDCQWDTCSLQGERRGVLFKSGGIFYVGEGCTGHAYNPGRHECECLMVRRT